MPKAPPGRPSRSRLPDEGEGLEWAAEQAPSPTMREFAKIALSKGLTLGAIARLRNSSSGGKLGAINVSRHFSAANPSEETLRSYAHVLGVSGAYLHLLRGVEPPASLVDVAIRRIEKRARLSASEFQSEAMTSFLAALSQLRGQERVRIGARVLLAEYRERFGIQDETLQASYEQFARRFGLPFAILAQEFPPAMDLLQHVKEDGDYRLVNLWMRLGGVFANSDDADLVIEFVALLLRRRGVDTQSMESAFAQHRKHIFAAATTIVPEIDDYDDLSRFPDERNV